MKVSARNQITGIAKSVKSINKYWSCDHHCP